MENSSAVLKNQQEIKSYQEINSSFIDYKRFEGNAKIRKDEQDAFIGNVKYTPNYDYPKLDDLAFDDKITEKKTKIYEAVMELEAAKNNPEYSPAELELYAGFHENRLKKIMLVEAARNIENPLCMSDSETNRRSFAELNESLYGKFNEGLFFGIMNTEKTNLDKFEPKNETAAKIKLELCEQIGSIDTDNKIERQMLTDSELKVLHDYVTARYADILNVVPDTPNDVKYDVSGCVEIMNRALEAGGLSQLGWKVSENAEKTSTATNGDSKNIYLPSSLSRNASELKMLIIHEQEVHARRSQNGEESGLNIIKKGTAEYADAEEGLAVILECAVSGNFDNTAFDRYRNRYIAAGLALGADGNPRDARQTYESLWRMVAVRNSKDGAINESGAKKAKETAYAIIENAYRGTQFWMQGVIYTKLKIYYEGLVLNADYFKDNINDLDSVMEDLFIGKYDHTNQEERDLVLSVIESKKHNLDNSVNID